MLVNWQIEYCSETPKGKQPPDYYISGQPYWFFRYFKPSPHVDIIDISSYRWLEKFEKNRLRFYFWQALKAIPRLGRYDLVVSHGMQSGVVLCLWRRLFATKTKHIVFDIGSFNSGAEGGLALKLMQFASKSLDGVIYHTSSQLAYYQKFFPWIAEKCRFIRFGTDLEFYRPDQQENTKDRDQYIICVGYAKRDWDTLIKAYQQLKTDVKLRLVGHVEEKYIGMAGVEQVPFIQIRDLIKQVYNAKFCILPLLDYNYSYGQMSLMQQMAMEKCVIVAEVPSMVDYVQDGLTAILYKPKDAEDLNNKMARLLQDESSRDRIGKNSRTFLAERCNERIMSHEIELFFDETVSKTTEGNVYENH